MSLTFGDNTIGADAAAASTDSDSDMAGFGLDADTVAASTSSDSDASRFDLDADAEPPPYAVAQIYAFDSDDDTSTMPILFYFGADACMFATIGDAEPDLPFPPSRNEFLFFNDPRDGEMRSAGRHGDIVATVATASVQRDERSSITRGRGGALPG